MSTIQTSTMRSILEMWRRAGRATASLIQDRRGIAATEFAFILPIMLVLFFGTVEFSSAIAVDRDVTLVARTLADLTSQSKSVADTDLTNFFTASCYILSPYTPAQQNTTISELYVDPITLKARVLWSSAATYNAQCSVVLGTGLAVDSNVAIPSSLAVGGTYLIFSQVSYLYLPAVGYVMAKTGITLADVAYTRPRQSLCVFYPTTNPLPTSCPTS
jgi:Flp pilus assembly protein TadG